MELSATASAEGFNVYVGTLNFTTSESDLIYFLNGARIGTVLNVKIARGANGTSKGYGLVTFASEFGAKACIEHLNGAMLHDRELNIREDKKTGSFTQTVPGASGGKNVGDGVSLFVNNLTWATDNTALKEMFAGFAMESACVVYGADGRSRGYALIKMSTPSEAERAMTEMNGKMYGGRDLRVRYDVGKKDAGAGAGGTGGGHKARIPGSSVFVGNLSWNVTWQTLKDSFAAYQPEYSDVKKFYDGRSRGWGTVRFASPEQAQRAIADMNGTVINGRVVEVRLDNGPGGSRNPGLGGGGRTPGVTGMDF
jgi:RNA recognition motif-containing protein